MKKIQITLTTLAACALLLPIAGRAQEAGTFPSFIAFDTQPEGVAVDKVGNVYVSTGVPPGDDQIWKISPAGEKSLLVDFGPFGYAAGLAVDAVGNVYMARPFVPGWGVLRVTADGSWSRVPGTDQIFGADALAFDQQGTLYITEVVSFDFATGEYGQGGIWRVPKNGTAELWLRHELLSGTFNILFNFPAGANGIGFYLGNLYVANTDKGTVVRVPVNPDGSPGEPEVWAQVQELPEYFPIYGFLPLMLDGLTLDVHGNVYVAVPTRSAIVRINAADRSQETIAVYPQVPLDAPLSLAFGTGNGERQTLFISTAGLSGVVFEDAGLTWPGAALVKTDAAIPGLPLP